MPSTMIHMLVAHEYATKAFEAPEASKATESPKASGAFFCGSFAPDFTNDRLRKDKMHLRSDPENRWIGLAQMAARFDPADPFKEGWLLHLFTDAVWGEGPCAAYIARVGEGWFPLHREQLGFASYWLFHHLDWAAPVMEAVLSAPPRTR